MCAPPPSTDRYRSPRQTVGSGQRLDCCHCPRRRRNSAPTKIKNERVLLNKKGKLSLSVYSTAPPPHSADTPDTVPRCRRSVPATISPVQRRGEGLDGVIRVNSDYWFCFWGLLLDGGEICLQVGGVIFPEYCLKTTSNIRDYGR